VRNVGRTNCSVDRIFFVFRVFDRTEDLLMGFEEWKQRISAPVKCNEPSLTAFSTLLNLVLTIMITILLGLLFNTSLQILFSYKK
jgi:hypothetical protein